MYSEKEAKDLVIEAGHKLVENKLIARTWGNISARISDEAFVITPSGRAYDNLKPEDIVTVMIKDCSYDSDIKPSSEKGIHAAAYRLRKDTNFVIHTHQFFASVVSADRGAEEFAPCAEYGLPGTTKLRKNVESVMESYPKAKMLLMANHGTLVMGDDFREAFDLAEVLETKCEAMFKRRVPSNDKIRSEEVSLSKLDTGYENYIIQQDEYVEECCRAGITLKPYIDDFAQIVGVDIKCCDKNIAKIKKSIRGRNAVLVKGVGAICFADNEEDAEAVAMILSKNCAAACYVRNEKPLGKIDSMLQRYVYLNKYSKQKDA
ncbi:MAG: class II aldolase/adducin family protein [Clostridiales bacterium]|nr:class II aldolase/adducin family protein [Clostridiales bacterium]